LPPEILEMLLGNVSILDVENFVDSSPLLKVRTHYQGPLLSLSFVSPTAAMAHCIDLFTSMKKGCF
jgi:hypothetical protein